MEDALRVGRFERLGDLPRDVERAWERERPSGEKLPDRLARHHLHDEELDVVGLLEAVDRGDVRVAEGGEELRLTLEPDDHLAVRGDGLRQDLQGDFTPEPRVARPPDFAHPADAQLRENLVGADLRAGSEAHALWTAIMGDGASLDLMLGPR